MAVFSFIKDAGRKIPELAPSGGHTAAQSEEKGETDVPANNPAAAEKLEKILKEYEFSVEGLKLRVEKDLVRISGRAKDQAIREKIILSLGNVEGIEEVHESITVERHAPESLFHTVEPADSLETIAEKVLGDPGNKEMILQANAPLLKKDKEIFPGMVLRIPSPERGAD